MKTLLKNDAWNKESLTVQQQKSILHPITALQSWQRNALADFLQQGFPDRHHEDWKYTNVAEIAEQAYTISSASSALKNINLNKIVDAYAIVFVDGQLRTDLSDVALLPKEVIVAETKKILEDQEWQTYLKFDQRYSTVFSNLNAALMTNGLFIYLPAKTVLSKPLHFIHYQTDLGRAVMHHPRHIVIADRESQLTLIEEYRGEKVYFNNVVTTIYAKEAAIISHYKLQCESLLAQHVAETVVQQEKLSTVTSFVFSLGARLNRDNLNFNLSQGSSSSHLYGLYLPLDNQHIDHHTRIDHFVPHCFSEQIYKGIISGNGHAVFNGKVVVHPQAQKTAAYQSNKNLLLSKTAEIDTKPELEIYADDVKCTHGATVGQLDNTALFYLRSRGIPQNEAKKMLTKAFAHEILTHIPHTTVSDYIHQIVEDRLVTI